jgi:type IV pilus modification protein PilV
MKRPRHLQHGFTMIEVMVAVLLTAIAIIGLVGLYTVESRASGYSRHQTEAAVLAQDKLERLRTEGPPAGASTGQESNLNELGEVIANGRYTRSWTISPSADVYDVVVTVSWDEDGTGYSVVVRAQRGAT